MINEKNIKKYLELGENQNLEFKESENKFPINALETISAFANTDGGIIILGVSEKEKNIISGVVNPQKQIKELFNHMNNPREISRNVLSNDDVYSVQIQDKSIIVIHVAPENYKNKPIYLKDNPNKTYIRQGEGDYLATEEIIQSMTRDASRDSYDNKLLDGYTIDDLDNLSIQKYKDILMRNNPDHPFNNLTTIDFLKKINVIKKNRKNNEECLTLAGLLVFGKHQSIKEYLPHYNVEYIRKSSNIENSSYSDRLIYDGYWGEDNLFNFMFSAFEKLKLTISDNSKISADYLTRESNSKLIIAIREALANSIIHCDFLNHKGVFIIRYPDRMIFINGGSLRISKEDYFTGAHSTPRNHYIQEIFRLINICEKAGTGVPKIMNAVKEYQLKKPEVKAEIDSFKLTIWDTSIIENLNISNEVEKGIIELIIRNKFCSRAEIEKELKISKTTTIKYLNSLKEKNILVSSKIGKVHVYKLNDTEQHLEKYNMVNTLYSIIEEIKRN